MDVARRRPACTANMKSHLRAVQNVRAVSTHVVLSGVITVISAAFPKEASDGLPLSLVEMGALHLALHKSD